MYLLTNAMKNLLRNKARNILIAAVTLAVIVSTAAALTINNAAAKVIDDIRLDLGSRVEISQNFIEMHQSGLGKDDASYISIDNFYSYAKSDYLRKTIFNADMYAWSDTFAAVGDQSMGTNTRAKDDGELMMVETLKLVSTSEPELLPDFGSLREITSGRMFDGLGECIISEEAAQLNNIALNDVIELRGAYAENKTYALVVVGIYSDDTDEYLNPWLAAFGNFYSQNRRNEIITGFDTLTAAGWESNAGLDMKTQYFLKNPDDIRKFENEVRAKGLPVTYSVSINQAAYEKMTGPLSGMKGAVFTFMSVILILGAVILALISFIAVRERKYEVGVLRAMGMEKGKIIFGILFESVIISAVCLVIGLAAGSLMAQPVADSLLEAGVAEAESVPERNVALFAGGQAQIGDGSAGYVPESEIQVNLNADVVLQIVMITTALAALSGVIGAAVITRYEPLKILRERN